MNTLQNLGKGRGKVNLPIPLENDRLFAPYDGTAPEVAQNVDLSNPLDDLFHVTVATKYLSEENNIYNSASTAPRTYSILDFERFVTSVKTYDPEENEIPTKRLSANRCEMFVQREDREVSVRGKLIRRMSGHVFEEMESPTESRKSLRERWKKPLSTPPISASTSPQPNTDVGLVVSKSRPQ